MCWATVLDLPNQRRGASVAHLRNQVARCFESDDNSGPLLSEIDKALGLHPTEAEIQACAAWCRFQVTGRTHDGGTDALAIFERAIEDAPKCARIQYYKGLVLMHRKDEPGAQVAFRAALEADRYFTDAERQLRAIMLRKKTAEAEASTQKKKGGLRGLFGRKD